MLHSSTGGSREITMIHRRECQSDPHMCLLKDSKCLEICQSRLKQYATSLVHMARSTSLTHSATSLPESSMTYPDVRLSIAAKTYIFPSAESPFTIP